MPSSDGSQTASRALLARVAESLYWIGRYTERAEGTARILDVVVHRALERRSGDVDSMATRVLAAMGVPSDVELDLWQVTEKLSFEPGSPCSIAGAFGAARENARSVRNLLPTELWEHLNSAWGDLPAQQALARRRGPGTFLTWVKDQAAAVSGLADTTMTRDQTWLFLSLGRALERADVTARLLDTVSLTQFTESGLVTLLRSCGGHEPYLRQAGGVIEVERVIDFLMRDPLFPRSALRSLVVAADCIVDLGAAHSGGWDEARAVVGMARAELEFLSPRVILDDLPDRLLRLHRACSLINAAVTERYFQHDSPTQWHRGVLL
jgi:uncharacterized alpha-E superfamily protein